MASNSSRQTSPLTAFPLLAIPVLVYNLLAFISLVGGDPDSAYNGLTQAWFSIPMPSEGTRWIVSVGDVIVLVGLFMLFFELLKSTSSDQVAIVNHSFSMILFIICLVEFLLLRPFGTSVFFLLTMMTLLDVLAGFIVTIITARRDFGAG
ncbi:MAG: hypothetical protein QM645_04790 [Asticcacaulis sp.]